MTRIVWFLNHVEAIYCLANKLINNMRVHTTHQTTWYKVKHTQNYVIQNSNNKFRYHKSLGLQFVSNLALEQGMLAEDFWQWKSTSHKRAGFEDPCFRVSGGYWRRHLLLVTTDRLSFPSLIVVNLLPSTNTPGANPELPAHKETPSSTKVLINFTLSPKKRFCQFSGCTKLMIVVHYIYYSIIYTN